MATWVRMFEGVGTSALAMVGMAGEALTCLLPGTAAGHPLSSAQLIVQLER
jgi:hypothetical protein